MSASGPTGPLVSEHGQVAYQIKWNHECSNMVADPLMHISTKIKHLEFTREVWGTEEKLKKSNKIEAFPVFILLLGRAP